MCVCVSMCLSGRSIVSERLCVFPLSCYCLSESIKCSTCFSFTSVTRGNPPSRAPPFIKTRTLVDGQIFSFMHMWKKEIILKKKANMHKSGLQSIFSKKCSNSRTTWLMEFLYLSPLEGFRNVLCL
mgnify:CR=1 FL=1